MKSLLASIVFAAGVAIALTGATNAQAIPSATPSMCPSPSESNSLVDMTMQHDCVTPTPSAAPKTSAAPTPALQKASAAPATPPVTNPYPQPTSKGEMR